MNDTVTSHSITSASGRLSTWGPWLLIVVAWAGIYATRPTALTLRGEEPRRARIAYEMISTGDYFVSRVQGVPEMGRPPLAEWLIAGSSLLLGEMNPLSIRLSAMLAVLLTAATLYVYAGRFCSTLGATAVALVYLSFGHVLQMGRIAETDALFTAMNALALLGWHHSYMTNKAPWRTWLWGYGWAAMAVLAKSPQAAVYFVAITGVYLVWRRDWRMLFAPGQVVGWFAFACVLAAWIVPYWYTTSYAELRENLFGQIEGRVGNPFNYAHFWKFPLQMIGALLPWSLLLFRYGDLRFVRGLGSARDAVQFCTTAVVVTFPTVWFSWPAGPRHLMPVYPCYAVLAGVVVDRVLAADAASSLYRGWRWLLGFMAVAAGVGGAAIWLPPLFEAKWARALTQTPSFAAVVTLVGAATAAVIIYSLRGGLATDSATFARRRFLGVAATVVVLGVAYAGIGVNLQVHLAEDHVSAMARLKESLPDDVRFISYGQVDNVFVYHYQDTIPVVKWPEQGGPVPEVGEYFLFDKQLWVTKRPSFAWEEVTVFSCDRNHHDEPQRPVVIARRIAEPVAATADAAAGGSADVRR